MTENTCFLYHLFKSCTFKACPCGFTFSPTLLLDRHLVLPVYYILRKFPTYPFISAYPFIEFDEKFQPTLLLEPTRLLER